MSKYSFETVYQVWHDLTGGHLEIGPDCDGLGWIQIRMYEPKMDKPIQEIGMDIEEAKLVVIALQKAIVDMSKVEETEVKGDHSGQ